MPDIEPTPSSASRRDRKAHAATGLVAAPPVHSARVVGATGARRGWLVGGGIAVAIVVAFSGVSLAASGSGGAGLPALNEAQDLRAADHLGAPCALPAAGEASGAMLSLEECDEGEESGDLLESVADDSESLPKPGPHASGQPRTPDDTRSGPVTPNSPAPGIPAPGAPTEHAPSSPVPSVPSPGPEPGPSQPAPGPAPTPSQPAPEPSKPAPAPSKPAPPVHVAKSLAFTGHTEKQAINLLGIKILSSYTVSLSGEPGSTATVRYGSSRAGSVTFNSSGRASITMGGALIRGSTSSTVIRAEYSDGTAGKSIQAPLNSI